MTSDNRTLTSKESHVASDRETVRRLSGDLALARNCLSNLLFAESALDKELARREARRFLGHPPTEHAHETGVTHVHEWVHQPRSVSNVTITHICKCGAGLVLPDSTPYVDLMYPVKRDAQKACEVRDSIAPSMHCPVCDRRFWADKFDGHKCVSQGNME